MLPGRKLSKTHFRLTGLIFFFLNFQVQVAAIYFHCVTLWDFMPGFMST